MKLSSLTAISPIDGRYNNKVSKLRTIFSEYGLLKFRVQVEIRWFQKLASCENINEIPNLNTKTNDFLNKIITDFSEKDAEHIKKIEHITQHDIKAVEYFLKKKIKKISSLYQVSEFFHFACTSEDINNIAYALMLKTARQDIILPFWRKIINTIKRLAVKYRDIPMLSRTHGQPATPSTVGKEFLNFSYRMERQFDQLIHIKIMGKMNGTVGNYNAHIFSYPEIDWHSFSKSFVTDLNISWNPCTTQIEPHDYISELFDCIMRFNIILIDFNRDIWGYMALNYFKQKITTSEIGSSIMPYKINPIDFENSEGNLGLSNAILNHLARKLPISRWQRDLTDSTVLRNLGVGLSYALISYQSTMKGINKLKINSSHLINELNHHWQVLSEPIQMIMRRYGIKKPYEKLKKFTHGKKIKKSDIKKFIESLDLPEKEKIRLKKMTPEKYIGHASLIVNKLSIL
ncbi:Adenylosuccinate lyase [Candidatus Ecksteinia adelgidicola]|nr:Adenylosuccinate lyase [Candidatus Ecksteinia adelgidicola]